MEIIKSYKVIAFDVFGTVVDLSQTPKDEIREYARHIRKPEWSYLNLPNSWLDLKPHRDSCVGINQLSKNYEIFACSNAPYEFMRTLTANLEYLWWDYIVPLELKKVYKPNPEAYKAILELVPSVKPEEVLFVTANKDFGDLEGSASVGMTPCLLERYDKADPDFKGVVAKDIVDLARILNENEM